MNNISKPEFLTLQDFVDPKLYEILNDPNLYEFTNKTMTVVFWDISGFSYICNTFKKQIHGVVVFSDWDSNSATTFAGLYHENIL
jgi:hypothetical protein